MLCLLLALGLTAASTPPSSPGEAPEAASGSAAPVPAAPGPVDVRATIDAAIHLRQGGDLAGARALLVGLGAAVSAADQPWYSYQQGICEELDGRPEAAVLLYEASIRQFEVGDAVAADARFRLALVLDDLGDGRGALEQMQVLARLRGLDEADARTVALETAISEIGAGRERRGVRDIQTALAPFAPDDEARARGEIPGPPSHAWLRAKARYALVRVLLEDAAEVKLRGRKKPDGAALERWAVDVRSAQEQIIALTHLQSADLDPVWLMRSLRDLGDTYAAMGEKLAASPTPRGLDHAQALVYRQGVEKKAENARTNAWHLYDEAVGVAGRLQFESPLVAELVARRAAIRR